METIWRHNVDARAMSFMSPKRPSGRTLSSLVCGVGAREGRKNQLQSDSFGDRTSQKWRSGRMRLTGHTMMGNLDNSDKGEDK